MLVCNNKPICLIGYPNSTLTQEAQYFMGQETDNQFVILSPEEFEALEDKSQYQYTVAFALDLEKRKYIIDIVDRMNLDCTKYVHNSVAKYVENVDLLVGRGTFVAPYSSILLGAKLGNHCIVETYCLISHYVELGNNVILHSGTMIAGRTTIGDNSMFNFKSSVLNRLTVCSEIEVGAASTVTKSIDQPGFYVGTPARRIGDVRKFDDNV